MAFNQPIQTSYARYHERGIVGLIARPGVPFWFDVGKVQSGETLVPGQAVLRNAAGDWEAVEEATSYFATHIIAYEQTDLNVPTLTGGNNQTSDIVYTEGQVVKALMSGVITLLSSASLDFDEDTQWSASGYIGSGGTARALSRIQIRSLSDVSSGQIFQAFVQPKVSGTAPP